MEASDALVITPNVAQACPCKRPRHEYESFNEALRAESEKMLSEVPEPTDVSPRPLQRFEMEAGESAFG